MMIGFSLGSNSVSRTRLGQERLINGSFDNGSTSWVVVGQDATHIATFSGGTLRYQSDTTTPQLSVTQSNVMTIGLRYEVLIEISSWTSGSIKTDQLGGNTVLAAGAGTFIVRGTASSTSFGITRNSTNVDITIARVSVRQVY